jgi:hypothetical protein
MSVTPSVAPSVVAAAAVMWVKITTDIASGDNRVTPGDPQTRSYDLPVTHVGITR